MHNASKRLPSLFLAMVSALLLRLQRRSLFVRAWRPTSVASPYMVHHPQHNVIGIHNGLKYASQLLSCNPPRYYYSTSLASTSLASLEDEAGVNAHELSRQPRDMEVNAADSITLSLENLPRGKTSSSPFCVTAPFPPAGDQPAAIEQLVKQIVVDKDQFSVLRGSTGTGKVRGIEHLLRPTTNHSPLTLILTYLFLSTDFGYEPRDCTGGTSLLGPVPQQDAGGAAGTRAAFLPAKQCGRTICELLQSLPTRIFFGNNGNLPSQEIVCECGSGCLATSCDACTLDAE